MLMDACRKLPYTVLIVVLGRGDELQNINIKNINHLRMNALRKPDSFTNWRRNRPSLCPSILRGVLLKIMYVMILKWIRERDVKYKSPRIAVSLVCCSKTRMALVFIYLFDLN